jgi:hypothetical protein
VISLLFEPERGHFWLEKYFCYAIIKEVEVVGAYGFVPTDLHEYAPNNNKEDAESHENKKVPGMDRHRFDAADIVRVARPPGRSRG